ncbi:hypothetical protein JAAARDRAFT_136107, partial [Jaapia argillacea MUCL 33604]
LFSLWAFLIIIFRDIPAMSLVVRMKGHNAISPCRMCKITGVRVPNSAGTTHYVPLDRSQHPEVRNSVDAVKRYDPSRLPLREHAEMLQQAQEVQSAQTVAQASALSKLYGIHGIPLLSHLKSLSFPQSFPFDFMHLIWENLIPNLVLLWTGGFKGLGEGDGTYQLEKTVWDAIGEAGVVAGDTVPYVIGPRLPNIARDTSGCNADGWSMWALYVGPVLLRRKFKNMKYYKHFTELVKLLPLCLEFELAAEDVEVIWQGFIDWVVTYER